MPKTKVILSNVFLSIPRGRACRALANTGDLICLPVNETYISGIAWLLARLEKSDMHGKLSQTHLHLYCFIAHIYVLRRGTNREMMKSKFCINF